MIDIKFIREHADVVKTAVKNKLATVDIDRLLELDEQRRVLVQSVDSMRADHNKISDQIGRTPDPEQRKLLIAKVQGEKNVLKKYEDDLAAIETEYTTLLKLVPNIPAQDVPIGLSEDENQVVKEVGEKRQFDFEPKNHWQLAENGGLIDKKRAAKVTGSRFAYIKGDLVRLQLAIVQFVIETLGSESTLAHIIKENGLSVASTPFVPVLPPLMIRTESYDAMDRLEPRDDRYKIEDEDLWLQGSAEHVLGSMHADETFTPEQLPLRYLGYATSFRREAGTYGKDMEGILRMHQFDKLEMESFSRGQDSLQEHLFFVAIQEYLVSQLGLPYRVLLKCTADIGKPNARGVDIETWLPGQNAYRETHTADYMTDFQSRRLNTRVRVGEGQLEFVHTNDATAFAIGRILIAIIENYQEADGSIVVPEVLRPYCRLERITTTSIIP